MNNRIAKKVIRRFQIALTLPPLFLRYCLYTLSVHKLYHRSLHDFSQLSVVAPGLQSLRGMTSGTERAYFLWYAKHIFAGCGDIVDLGCGLGSTTIPLAIGLAKNRNQNTLLAKIHAYDSFIWVDDMNQLVERTPLQGRYKSGDSFLDEFNRRIDPWKDRIIVHSGDLRQIKWDSGSIEFLLIDAMKSGELANSIVSNFFPALIPGRSYILHQDFAHWYTPWIHIICYKLRDYFEPVYEVPFATSVVFKLTKPIPIDLVNDIYELSSLRIEEIDRAFKYSFGLVSESKRPNIAAAKVMLFINLGDLTQAQRELGEFRSQRMTFASDLSIVEGILADTGSAL